MKRLIRVVLCKTPGGRGGRDEMTAKKVNAITTAKITGSILLVKHILLRKSPVKLIWLTGKVGVKPASLSIYAALNAGISGLVNQLNATEKKVSSYLLAIGVIS